MLIVETLREKYTWITMNANSLLSEVMPWGAAGWVNLTIHGQLMDDTLHQGDVHFTKKHTCAGGLVILYNFHNVGPKKCY